MSRRLLLTAMSLTALFALPAGASPTARLQVAQAPDPAPPGAPPDAAGGAPPEQTPDAKGAKGGAKQRGGDRAGPPGERPARKEQPATRAQGKDGGEGRGRGGGERSPPPTERAQQKDSDDGGGRRGRRGDGERAAPTPPPPAPQAAPAPAAPPAQSNPPPVEKRQAQPPVTAPPAQKQQAQPAKKAPPPTAERGGEQGRGEQERGEQRRGDRGERRDGERGPRGPAGEQPPPKQAQPTSPPAQLPRQAQPPPPPPPRQQAGPAPTSIEGVKKNRRQRVEDGGKRTIIEEPGRTIVQEKGGRAMIRHDERDRLRRTSRDVRTERRRDGGNLTIAIRPGGIEVFSEFDSDGRLQRRYRRGRDGRETNLIDNRRFRGGGSVILDLRPPVLRMPRDRYIVDYERASDRDLYDTLEAGPIERLDRGYSLDEIRYNAYLRDRMRRIDLDTVTFEFGAWQVPPDQYRRLERIANAINRVIDQRPDEVFLIEGHTDAVGSEIDNLTLSDRRAEEVAIILTDTFGVPPENLVTQGYGEEFLKVPTEGAERLNRRVAARRITPLLAGR